MFYLCLATFLEIRYVVFWNTPLLSHLPVATLSFFYRGLYLPLFFIIRITPTDYLINRSAATNAYIFFIQATVSDAG